LRQGDDAVIAWSGSRTGTLLGVPLHPVDLTDRDTLSDAFRAARPDVVVHTAALTTIAGCFRSPLAARAVNVEGSAALAELAAAAKARLLLLSTDLVFDGERGWYREQDAPSPLSIYGQSKVAAEAEVLAVPGSAVARVSLLFGPSIGGRSFFDEQVAALRGGTACTLFEDEWRTPLGVHTAARAVLDLARSDFVGVVHVGGPERLSRLEMGRRLAAFLRCDPEVIVPAKRSTVASPEPRPRDTSLDSTRWRELFPDQAWPTWDEAIREMMPG
jgi:dTDP-4-dehydrorhamnose reductase